ncbi:hypothetical protein GCM10011452_09060 [Gemmobacter lanyuensis]|uniref:Uncharacterized protein n=1 Tax=Gemmobacter lanyuensis TaxID=1054497 RepID=A0A918IPE4_9RHOB|nr:hypothetical protein [Gemmobacter lanyuensis]GGW23904.1 hypothetical protein GCM10011452_09060 [Gemmobacter lanyuensis]
MTRYTATIRHHSIASARVVNVGNDLTAAKTAATKEFGGEMRDYTIVIIDTQCPDPWNGDVVASKRVCARSWK